MIDGSVKILEGRSPFRPEFIVVSVFISLALSLLEMIIGNH